jgi:hypothetical protein
MMMNKGKIVCLPDRNDEGAYPQSFHNHMSDDDSDGDIRTVKTNTSLTQDFPDDLMLFHEMTLVTTNESDEDYADDEHEGFGYFPKGYQNQSVGLKNTTSNNHNNRILRKHEQIDIMNITGSTNMIQSVPNGSNNIPAVVTPPATTNRRSACSDATEHRYCTDEHMSWANFGNRLSESPSSSYKTKGNNNFEDDSINTFVKSDVRNTLDIPFATNACHDDVVATKISNKFLPKAIVGDASVLQNHKSATSDVTTNDNHWIKTSWSYLQMMAGVASLPVSAVNNPRSDEGEIVDLDGSLSYPSTTNNLTCNNDILSLYGADEQRSFDSSLFQMKNQMGKTTTVDVPAQDDTSTLPSLEGSGYFNSAHEGVHQSLFDPVKMIHAGTESTFIVAYGSSEDDSLKGLGKTSQDAPADTLNIVDFAQTKCDDTLTNEENRRTSFTKRRCLWMVIMLFILTALAFATSEVVCMF